MRLRNASIRKRATKAHELIRHIIRGFSFRRFPGQFGADDGPQLFDVFVLVKLDGPIRKLFVANSTVGKLVLVQFALAEYFLDLLNVTVDLGRHATHVDIINMLRCPQPRVKLELGVIGRRL